MEYKPKVSPWGEIHSCEKMYTGIYFVTTAGHGGIMIEQNTARVLLSNEAIKCGFKEDGYVCFEEDSQANVVEKDLLMNGIWSIPDKVNDKVAYENNINQSLMTYNPDYWQYVESTQKDIFFDVINKNLMEYISVLKNDYDKEMLINSAPEISSIFETHKYLKESYSFKYNEISFLLKCDNPLLMVSDKRKEQRQDLSDMDFTLLNMFEDKELIKESKLSKDDNSKIKKGSIKKELKKVKENVKKQVVLQYKRKIKER